MKLSFTEFSYGYAFTENLIRWSGTRPNQAPVFPNLIQEGRLGYDVKIEMPALPLFFQFKLPELMVRDTAREIKKLRIADLTAPFFRMSLMRPDISDQHINLIHLEHKFPNSVFYVSPKFHDSESFNQAYIKAEVHILSACFSPNDIGKILDNKSHSIAYPPDSSVAWLCSEPRKVKISNFNEIMRIFNEEKIRIAERTFNDVIPHIREKIWPLIRPELKNVESELSQRIKTRILATEDRERGGTREIEILIEMLTLRDLIRVGLNADLLIAQPRAD